MSSPLHSTVLDPLPLSDVKRPLPPPDGRDGDVRPATMLARLRAEIDQHPLWSCRLLRACELGHLSRDDFRYLFSQYAHYSRNFTRYLAALMARCESDYFRAALSENLWEEGGMRQPEERHSQIFREFLGDGGYEWGIASSR